MQRNRLITLIVIFVAVVSVLGLTGCKSQNNIVGTWAVSMGGASNTGLTWQFTQDGKFTQGGGTQDVNGTYKLSGDTLSMTTTVNNSTETSTMAVKWISADQFTGAISGMAGTTLTFTRQK